MSNGDDGNREWNVLMRRLHAALGTSGPSTCKDGQVFISYCARNSEVLAKYGGLPTFVGSAWADPCKVKDGLESSKAKSCWMDYENSAFLARQGLFNGVHSAMMQSEVVVVCMSNEYMGTMPCAKNVFL